MSADNMGDDEIARQLMEQHMLGDDADEGTKAELEKQRVALGDKTDSNHKGGLKFTNAKILEFQRRVIWDFMKEVGWNFASGKATDLISISLPVKIFEAKSFLQRITDGWYYAPELLNKAAQSSDPVYRFKCVMAFALGGLKHTVKQWKPFNPILGETYQATYADGSTIHLEQSSHHPPVTHWQVFAADGSWTYYGYAQYSASLRGNSLKGVRTGPNIVSFSDGQRISFDLPSLFLNGVLWGERSAEYLGTCTVKDKKNGLVADLTFNPDAVGFVASFFYSAQTPTDYFKGDIVQNGNKIGACTGSWITHIDVDGKRFFDFNNDTVSVPKEVENPLPSDSRFREDLQSLAKGDYEAANTNKIKLEQLQRSDRKLRAKYADGEESTSPKSAKSPKSTN